MRRVSDRPAIGSMDKNNRTNNKNEYIELLRFVLCMMIFIHHSGHVTGGAVSLLPSGGLVADAFFILTGYYAVRHIYSRMEKNRASGASDKAGDDDMTGRPLLYVIRYTLHKLIRVFPYMAFGTVIIYVLECVTDLRLKGAIESVDIIHRLKDMVIELLYLPLTGLMGEISALNYRNAPMWYLSAMLMALPIVMYLCIRLCKPFKYVIVWVVPFILQILMMHLFGGILPWQQFAGFVNGGYIRGISSILMGGAVYFASGYLRSRFAGERDKADTESSAGVSTTSLILTVAEIVLLISFVICTAVGVTGYYELMALYVIGIVLALCLSGTTYTSHLKWKPARFLGRLSLPIYCLHWGIYRWVAAFFGYLDHRVAIVLTFVLCVGAAVILMMFIDKLNKRGKASA